MKISVMATCFNNMLHVGQFISEVRNVLEEQSHDFEIVIVDDGSIDASWEVIRGFSELDSRIIGLRLSKNFGQHPAILAGLDSVRGDLVVLMDSDLDDDPRLLPRLIDPLVRSDADLVLTRHLNPRKRRFSSRVFHKLSDRSSGKQTVSHVGTYRSFNAEVLTALRSYRDHSTLFGPISTQLGFRQMVLDIPDNGQARNKSSYTFLKRLKLAAPTLINEVAAPLRLLVVIVTFMISSVLALGLTATIRFISAGGNLASTTSLVFLTLLVNQALLGIGILVTATYARMTLKESLKRPRYHIAQRSN